MTQLEAIMARTVEDCDCLIWQGPTNASSHPVFGGHTVRRLVWSAHHGQTLDARRLVSVTCGNPKCVNPEHLALTSKAEVSRVTGARRDVRIRRAASCARTNRAKFGKITMDIAQEIRASDKTGKALAAEHGVSESLISLVRRGRSWVMPNPFGGLL
jgi:hypothetical protein